MTATEPEYGTFRGGIPHVRFGRGDRELIVFSGGPGNTLPTGMAFKQLSKGYEPLAERYRIHLITRKSGLPEGYTTRDMADDYAQMIRDEFGGRVDLVIGVSYGGLIAQHFAADHTDLFDQIVIAMAAHKISEVGRDIDWRFAQLLSQGKTRSAYALIGTALVPKGIERILLKGLLWLFAGSAAGEQSETFREDVLIEAEAEMAHDASDSLPRIAVPVLIVCGDEDVFFPPEYVQEMADLIPRGALKIYEGKGRDALADQRFAQDVLEFVT